MLSPAEIIKEVTGGKVTGGKKTGEKFDRGKDRWDLFSWKFGTAVVKVLTYGVQKYASDGSGRAADNWRTVPDALNRYQAAFMRHWVAYLSGEWADPESGLPHLWHCACNLMFLVELANAPP